MVNVLFWGAEVDVEHVVLLEKLGFLTEVCLIVISSVWTVPSTPWHHGPTAVDGPEDTEVPPLNDAKPGSLDGRNHRFHAGRLKATAASADAKTHQRAQRQIGQA